MTAPAAPPVRSDVSVRPGCGPHRHVELDAARRTRSTIGAIALLAVVTAGCGADAEPAGPARVEHGPVPAAVEFVEAAAGVQLDEVPTIWSATPTQIRSRYAAERAAPPPDRWILDDPDSRTALGLASERWSRPVSSAPAFFDRDRHEIVVSRAPGRGVQADVLVHELVHAVTAQDAPIDEDAIGSSDQRVAVWMVNEGVATALERQWTDSHPGERPSATPPADATWDLCSLGYEVGSRRARFEFGQLDPGERWTTATSRVATSAAVLDPRLPLGWTPVPVDEPAVPDGAEVERRDRLGVFGWLEVLAQDPASDQSAVLGWRGEATTSYRSPDGRDCVVSASTTTDEAAARRLAQELASALPHATSSATAELVRLDACGEPGRASPPTVRTDVEPLLAFLVAAFGMLEDGVGPDHVVVDADTAWCVAQRVHDEIGWIEAYRTWDEVTGPAHEAAALARCLAGSV